MSCTSRTIGPADGSGGGPAGRCYGQMGESVRAARGSLRKVEPGAPAWVKLGTTAGTTTAARFYCGLFGWSVVARHRPLEDTSGHWTFRDCGRDIGGLAPAREATWTVYMRATDVDAMAQAVADNGGRVLVTPTTIADTGRMAACADPLGASFVLWQDPDPDVDGTHERRSLAWYQLAGRDIDVAKRFYRAVFGWEARTTPFAEGSTYTELFQPGRERGVAAMVGMDQRSSEDVRPHWMTNVAVDDTDRTVARAAELGGIVSMEPVDLPDIGRIAVLNDPENVEFSVLQAA